MKQLLSILTILLFGFGAYASHVPGGGVTYSCLGGNQYLITLTLYEDCGSAFIAGPAGQPPTPPGNYTVNIANDCGITGLTTASLSSTIIKQEISQLCSSQLPASECNGGGLPGIYLFEWQGIVTLPADCDSWTFSYSSCCRNASTNGVGTGSNYYFEAILNSATAPCNSSPIVTAQPIPYTCVNQNVNYNLGVYEPDGNTLVYSFIPAMTSATGVITYVGGYSSTTPIPGITINSSTGTINFTPTGQGNYIVVVLIEEFDVNGNLVGSIEQDFQFEVINCAGNNNPVPPASGIANYTGGGVLTGPDDIQMCEGDYACFEVTFTDDVTDSIYLTSNVLTIFPNATFTQTSWINGSATAQICLTILPGSNPFSAITVNAGDNACPVIGVNAYTFGLTVISSTFAGLDQTICLNEGVQLNANGGSTFSWVLVSGDPITATNFSCTNCQTPFANPAVSSMYEVTSNLAGGCTNVDTIEVVVVPDFNYTLTQSSTTSCLNSDIDLNITPTPAGAYNYVWTPGTYLSGTTIANPTMTPTAPGNYQYAVEISTPAGCIKYDTIDVLVTNAVAPNVTVTTNLNSIMCGDTIFFDTDLGCGPASINGTSGSNVACGTTSQQTIATAPCGSGNSTTSWPAPFGNWYRNAKHQFLYLGSELQAAGFIGGQFTQIGWIVDQINGTSNYNQYSIKMGVTGVSTLSNWQSGLDQVYGPQNISITTGMNSFNFATPFYWDGVSNIVVEICYDNLSTSYTQNSVTQWDCTSFNSSLYYRSDSQSACAATTSTSSTNRPLTMLNGGMVAPDPANFTYSWPTGSGINSTTTQNPYALPQSTTDFQLIVTNNNGGCTDTVITHIDVLCDTCQAPIPTLTPATCFGESNGEIFATPVGVNGPPFNIQILDPISMTILQQDANVVANTTFSGLAAGDYLLRSYDTTGCWADTLVTIVEPPQMTIIISNDTIVCIGGSADISATAGGGNGTTYTYNWGGGIANTAGGQTVTPAVASAYDVYALDMLNCSSDTLEIDVNMYPPILSAAGAPDTVCPGFSGNVSVTANGGFGGTYFYNWTDDQGNPIGTSNPQTVTPTSGPTTYYVLITDNCQTPAHLDSVVVEWYGVPQPTITPDVIDGCFPVDVTFTGFANPSLVDQCYWDFGDGNVSTTCGNVFNSYTNPGSYDVSLTITSPDGCVGDTTYSNLIDVYDYPNANFVINPSPIDVLNPTTNILNLSSGDVTSYNYIFMDSTGGIIGSSNLPNTEWTFPDANPTFFDVMLIVTNAHGCTDTISNKVHMDGVYNFYTPSAFTPNGDGVNDTFYPMGEGVEKLEYDMMIFDRWGGLVFQTTDMNKAWDGTIQGLPANGGVYVWKVFTKDQYTGEEFEHIGHVMMIK